MKTKQLTTMAMLTALSVVLAMSIRFPLIPSASFLEYTPSDIPVLIGTFAFGPMTGLTITIIVALIQGLTVSASSSVYGILMHIIASGVFALVAGRIYRNHKTQKTAAIALVTGMVSMVAAMILFNLLITPHFTGLPFSAVKDMIIPIILPFNLIKAGVNGIATFILYKPMMKVFQIPEKPATKTNQMPVN